MNEWEGPFPPRSKPIRVEGGIRARTARGAIGQQWWSRRFIEVLEGFELRGRLSRGRTYARQGQVLALEVEPGSVHATVQGSRTTPYQVRVDLAPLPEAAWDAVEHALAEQAIYCAQLLAGEMPRDIEDVFAAAGAPLFPRQRGEVGMFCTCPDQAVPCKHLAAAFYLLAESFDEDPFRILHWRGRDRQRLLTRLRELRGGPAGQPGDAGAAAGPDGGEPAGAGAVGAGAVGAAAAMAEVTSPRLAEVSDRFWLSPVPLPDRPPPTLPAAPDLLLRQLPTPGPALGGVDLVTRLRPAYHTFGAIPTADPGEVLPDSPESGGNSS